MRKQLRILVWAAVAGVLAMAALVVVGINAPAGVVAGQCVVGLLLGMLALSGWQLERRLGRGIGELGRGLGALVKLDLSVRSTVKADDEISRALRQYNASAWELSGVVKSTRTAVQNMSQMAQQLDHGVATLGQVASQQDAALESLSLALEQARGGAEGAEVQAAAGDHAAQLAARVLVQLSGRLDALASQSATMGRTLELLRGVAEQVNLVAVNAAIETARAGDAGRGFGQVSEDLRKLAAVATVASRDVEGVVEQALTGMQQARASLRELDGMVQQVGANSTPVVQAVARQRSLLDDIGTALAACQAQWPDVARRVEEAQGARVKLAQYAGELGRQTERFKV